MTNAETFLQQRHVHVNDESVVDVECGKSTSAVELHSQISNISMRSAGIQWCRYQRRCLFPTMIATCDFSAVDEPYATKSQFCWRSTADSELRITRLLQQYSSVIVVQQLRSESEARSCRSVCRQQSRGGEDRRPRIFRPFLRHM